MNRLHSSSSARVLALSLAIHVLPANAASPTTTVDLATTPLANSSTTVVKPNIMFTLDDSGSMDRDYLPDWANSNTAKLKRNAAYNGVAYNPSIVYTKPVNYDAGGALNTTTYPDQTGQTSATGANSDAKPNWKYVKQDGYGIQSTDRSNLTFDANSYTFIPGEYCTTPTLETCAELGGAVTTTTHPYPAYVRWCTSSAPITCRSLYNSSTHTSIRYPGMGNIRANITFSGGANKATSSIIVDGHQILSYITNDNTNNTTVAERTRDAINACTYEIPSGSNCTIYGYSATSNNNVVTITSPFAGYSVTPAVTTTVGGVVTPGLAAATAFSAVTTPGQIFYRPIIPNITAYNYPGTSAKHPNRTDCAGTSCTYAEEMQNYANWYTYYRTRMQAMKTSVSRAFKILDKGYRVGFNSISYTGASNSNTKFLSLDTFELTQKNTWYNRLFASNPVSYTPLRAAISKVGRIFAKKQSGAADPIQYSCQQNFHILSTDGYWNTEDETTGYGPFQVDSNTNVGNLDGGTTALPYKEGATASNTLADVAMYYYNTDLRTSTLNNCTGATLADGTTNNVCENNVFTSDTDLNDKQHVTQFTMGLGIDGTLNFQTDYLTATSGDYYDLKRGIGGKAWPNPISNTNEARIDDLWHAAVNGRGTYFSAKDPDSIVRGFTSALTSIKAKAGAGAAAATSTLNPVAGDNYAYVASYTTVKWQGNLEARTIDINPASASYGSVSENAQWCVESVLADNCTGGSIEAISTPTGLVYNCVKTPYTAGACSADGGSMDAADPEDDRCLIPIATSCTGTLSTLVAATSDTRTIYMANATGNGLIDFNYANVDARDLENYFAGAYLDGKLSQWSDLTAAQKTEAQGANMIKFLRGQHGYEDRSTNATAGRSTLYRFRAATLGDITESQPTFVGKPIFNYSDRGYKDFVTAKTSRAKTIFVGANDGMLHAFNAETGVERWAFVPTAVIPNLWALADKLYSGKHMNYVNGQPVIADVYDSSVGDCGTSTPATPANCWKTILVAGLNGGGRGYYAMDITNPVSPILLWELSSANLPNMGYSFGAPVVTKNSAGTWVVLLTSGYNNVGPGNGEGYLFVRNALTGAEIKTIGTGVGSTTVPSGLAKIANYADQGNVNNSSLYVYGGDLMGNVWRFDINSAAATGMKFAVLKASNNTTQPITATPELGVYNNKRMIFVGTGKYLETGDLGDTQEQTIYGIKDDNETVTFDNPRASTTLMVEQQLSAVTDGRTSTKNPVDIFTQRGWFIDFPDAGERVHVNPKLDAGALFVPTTVPSNTACSPGGYGWFNYFDYRNGWPLQDAEGNLVSQKTTAPIVGFNIFYMPDGQRVIGVVTADGPTPKKPPKGTGDPRAGNKFGGVRIMWREILTP